MNKLLKLFGLIVGLSSVIWMLLLLIGLYQDGIYYFYEFNKTIIVIELIIVVFAIPILILIIKEVIEQFGQKL